MIHVGIREDGWNITTRATHIFGGLPQWNNRASTQMESLEEELKTLLWRKRSFYPYQNVKVMLGEDDRPLKK